MTNGPRVSLIAALSRNRVIGRENALPWRIPEDLKRFRAITSGKPVIMGRKTFDSIGRVLPNRENIVISRQTGLAIPGARVLGSVDEALAACGAQDEVFVIGGAEIYRQTLPRADRLVLTLVDTEIEGDAFFPEWPAGEFSEVERVAREQSEPEALRFSFVTLERRK